MTVQDKSCWTCGFQKKGGPNTFLGICLYFEVQGKESKQIPENVVDIGCKFWKQKETDNERTGQDQDS